MAQSGSVLAWGARGPGFESQYPDIKNSDGVFRPCFFASIESADVRRRPQGLMRRIRLLCTYPFVPSSSKTSNQICEPRTSMPKVSPILMAVSSRRKM